MCNPIKDTSELIKQLRKSFPSIIESVDDLYNLLITQWLSRFRRKRDIKNEVDVQKYKSDLFKEISKIPKNKLSEPDISILGPALEASRYYISNETLREMFAKVAASSMDNRKINYSRSSFIEFIKQLSPLDIKLLKSIRGNLKIGVANFNQVPMKIYNPMPIIDIQLSNESNERLFAENVVPNDISHLLNVSYNSLSSSIDNMVRLNIINKHIGKLNSWYTWDVDSVFKNNDAIKDAQKEIEDNKKEYAYQSYKQHHSKIVNEDGYKVNKNYLFSPNPDKMIQEWDNYNVKSVYYYISLTSLGKDFCNACM